MDTPKPNPLDMAWHISLTVNDVEEAIQQERNTLAYAEHVLHDEDAAQDAIIRINHLHNLVSLLRWYIGELSGVELEKRGL